MALESAKTAGFEIPNTTFDKISRYLDSVGQDDGSKYGYMPGQDYRLSMTAEGLLCRQYPRPARIAGQGRWASAFAVGLVFFLLDCGCVSSLVV